MPFTGKVELAGAGVISHTSGPMEPFHTLTRRGQARRLRQLARKALAAYPLEVVRLRLLSYETNAVFRVDAADGSRYVLRVISPEADHNLEETRAEMGFLDWVVTSTDLGVPRPLRTRDGAWVVIETAEGVPEPRTCVLMTWLTGKVAAEDIRPALYERVGETAARLHQAALGWSAPRAVRRINRVFYFNDPVLIFKKVSDPALYYAAADKIQHGLDELWADREAARVIHADLNPWNMLLAGGRLYIIDFEDLMLGFPVQDVAISLYYLRRRADYPALRAAFQRGYSRHLPWPDEAAFRLHFIHRAMMLLNFCYVTKAPAGDIAAWLDAILPTWLADS